MSAEGSIDFAFTGEMVGYPPYFLGAEDQAWFMTAPDHLESERTTGRLAVHAHLCEIVAATHERGKQPIDTQSQEKQIAYAVRTHPLAVRMAARALMSINHGEYFDRLTGQPLHAAAEAIPQLPLRAIAKHVNRDPVDVADYLQKAGMYRRYFGRWIEGESLSALYRRPYPEYALTYIDAHPLVEPPLAGEMTRRQICIDHNMAKRTLNRAIAEIDAIPQVRMRRDGHEREFFAPADIQHLVKTVRGDRLASSTQEEISTDLLSLEAMRQLFRDGRLNIQEISDHNLFVTEYMARLSNDLGDMGETLRQDIKEKALLYIAKAVVRCEQLAGGGLPDTIQLAREYMQQVAAPEGVVPKNLKPLVLLYNNITAVDAWYAQAMLRHPSLTFHRISNIISANPINPIPAIKYAARHSAT